MPEGDISALEQRLHEDDDLLEEFKQSPVEVLTRHGISLTDEERQNVTGADLASQSHEQIRSLIANEGLSTVF